MKTGELIKYYLYVFVFTIAFYLFGFFYLNTWVGVSLGVFTFNVLFLALVFVTIINVLYLHLTKKDIKSWPKTIMNVLITFIISSGVSFLLIHTIVNSCTGGMECLGVAIIGIFLGFALFPIIVAILTKALYESKRFG